MRDRGRLRGGERLPRAGVERVRALASMICQRAFIFARPVATAGGTVPILFQSQGYILTRRVGTAKQQLYALCLSIAYHVDKKALF